ncbi:MAG: SpoIID/LytB domain-containing protein [Paludibacter sp.]|nr:SpoIID/LytB domain-containing protein [Paludibacter sp.]
MLNKTTTTPPAGVRGLSEPIIQVGILSSEKIEFILNGTFVDNNGNSFTGRQIAQIQGNSILLNSNLYNEINFESVSENASFDLIDVVIGINFHWERKENQRFKGALKLIVENGQLTAINRIGVEDYLTSVISSEMSATASDELLKAHAVISRSWLLYPITTSSQPSPKERELPASQQSKKTTTDPQLLPSGEAGRGVIKWYERDAHIHFDVCADDHCQRYQGITRASTQAVEAAIEATRGEVLMYEDSICDARFSKCCGGASETFENCWAPVHHPYLVRVFDSAKTPDGFETNLTNEQNAQKWIRLAPDAFCNTSDKKVLAQVLNNYDQETTDFYRWKVEYSQAEIAELLHRRSGIDFGQIIDLTPLKRGESGRIIELKIVGTLQTVVVGKELEIRKWLSNSHLYSSAFVVDKHEIADGIPQKFVLSGAGWGHGVGLCQIGAAMMGEKGYFYKDILLHYFRGAELKRIY